MLLYPDGSAVQYKTPAAPADGHATSPIHSGGAACISQAVLAQPILQVQTSNRMFCTIAQYKDACIVVSRLHCFT